MRYLLIVIAVVFLVFWFCYFCWDYFYNSIIEATVESDGSEIDLVLLTILRFVGYLIFFIPGFIYSELPLPKEFENVLMVESVLIGLFFILNFINNNTEKQRKKSSLERYRNYDSSIYSHSKKNNQEITHKELKRHIITGESTVNMYNRSEKVGYSKENKNFLTDEKTFGIYDMEGNRTGYVKNESHLFSQDRLQSYNSNNERNGYSVKKTNFFTGKEYTQDYTEDGEKNGHWEMKEKVISGKKYSQHYDKDGKPIK